MTSQGMGSRKAGKGEREVRGGGGKGGEGRAGRAGRGKRREGIRHDSCRVDGAD